MTRTRKKALIIGGILIALPVLFVEEHFRGKWALAKLKRQLVAKGEKLTVDECRPPFPEAQDNCFGELMNAATLLSYDSASGVAPGAMRMVAPGKARVLYNLNEWPIVGGGRRGQPTNSNWQLLEAALAGSTQGLIQVRAALRKPVYDARVMYSLHSFQVPHLAKGKRIAQCLCGDALLQIHLRRPDLGLEDLESTLRLSALMQDERTMISQLVRIAVAALAVGPTWQALQTPGWEEHQLAQLQRAWETNDFLRPAIHALEMERAMCIDMFQLMRDSVQTAADVTSWSANATAPGGAGGSGVQSVDDFIDNIDEEARSFVYRGIYIPTWQFAWSREDERNYLETMQTVLVGARESQKAGSVRPVSDAAAILDRREREQSLYSRIRHLASGLLGGSLTTYVHRAVMAQAQREMVCAAIGVRRFELRHGKPPASLDQLVPEFAAQLPRDVFAGQPLRYRLREGGGFLLYSVGRDGRDDGGDPDAGSSGGSASQQFHNGRDIVWPVPGTAEEVAADAEKVRRKK